MTIKQQKREPHLKYSRTWINANFNYWEDSLSTLYNKVIHKLFRYLNRCAVFIIIVMYTKNDWLTLREFMKERAFRGWIYLIELSNW